MAKVKREYFLRSYRPIDCPLLDEPDGNRSAEQAENEDK